VNAAALGITVVAGLAWIGFIAASIQRRHAAHCELDLAHAELDRIVKDDQAWKPGYILDRVYDIYAHIEEARAAGDAKGMHGLATSAGEEAVRKTLWVAGAMRPEPRDLAFASIALTDDKPGVLDDKAWIMVRGVETKCQEEFQELWRMVRGGNGDWRLDAIEADPAAIKAIVERPAGPGIDKQVAARRYATGGADTVGPA